MIAHVTRFAIVSAAVVAASCGGDGGSPPATDRVPENASWASDESINVETLPDSTLDTVVRIDTVARGLEVPWSAVSTSDSVLLVTERNGRVRIVRNDSLIEKPLAQLEIRKWDSSWNPESGLTGIAITPDYDWTGSTGSGSMFLLATYERESGNIAQQLASKVINRIKDRFDVPVWQFENRVVRIPGDTMTGIASVFDKHMPTFHYHAGGFLHIGPDGKLYVSLGDGTYPKTAQNPRVLTGKILRLNTDGTIPNDNPIPGSPIFASGLRNSQGMVWHPESGTIFAVDHGPTGMPRESFRGGNDELNVIVPGGNYGWPIEGGEWGAGAHQQPIRVWRRSIAPSGLASLPTGDPNKAELIISSLGQMSLRWLSLTRSGQIWRVNSEKEFLRGRFGRLRILNVGLDGTVLIGTSNRDGRGSRNKEDDLVLRLRFIRAESAQQK